MIEQTNYLPITTNYLRKHPEITIGVIDLLNIKNLPVEKKNNYLTLFIPVSLKELANLMKNYRYNTKESDLYYDLDVFIHYKIAQINYEKNMFSIFAIKFDFKRKDIIVLPYYNGLVNDAINAFFAYKKIPISD